MGLIVTDYQIFSALNSDELRDRVRKGLGQGWQPIGGAFLSVNQLYICQTMVKYGPERKVHLFGGDD